MREAGRVPVGVPIDTASMLGSIERAARKAQGMRQACSSRYECSMSRLIQLCRPATQVSAARPSVARISAARA